MPRKKPASPQEGQLCDVLTDPSAVPTFKELWEPRKDNLHTGDLHAALGMNPGSATEPHSPDQLSISRIVQELDIEKEMMGIVKKQMGNINS